MSVNSYVYMMESYHYWRERGSRSLKIKNEFKKTAVRCYDDICDAFP